MGKNDTPSLVLAAIVGDMLGVTKLLAEGSEIEDRDRAGRTALHNATINKHTELVRLLISSGANANVRDKAGWTPLHFAAQEYALDIAQLLLEAGGHVDSQDDHGNTPLGRATFESKGRGDMIRFLLSRGADRNLVNKHGVSPVALARNIGNYDVKHFFEP